MLTADKRKGGWLPVLRFLLVCWKLNAAGAMEFRLSFFMTAGMMFINNFIWLVFWGVFFHRFPNVAGWELQDVMLMWAVGAGGFGWSNILFGNYTRVAHIVANGQLDVYLTQPKPVLLNMLASRMSLTAAGDLLFAFTVYGLVGDHTLRGAALYALGLLISGLLFLFFALAAGSLAFFIGNSEGLSLQMFHAFVSLSTYPTDIFRGAVRLMLFTAVPAGIISYMPIGLLKEMRVTFALTALGITALAAAAALLLFSAGLRRYTSGNQLTVRM